MIHPRFLIVLPLLALASAGCGDDKKTIGGDKDAATEDDGGNVDASADGGESDAAVAMGCGAGETPTGTFPLSGGAPIWGGWVYAGTSLSGTFTPEENECELTHGFYIEPLTGFPTTDLSADEKKNALCAINHGAELTVHSLGVAPNPPESCAATLPCSPETKLLWDSAANKGYVYQYFEDAPRQLIGYMTLDDEGRLLVGPGPGYSVFEHGPASYTCFEAGENP